MILAALLLASAPVADINQTVEVEGKSYRVTVKKGVVKVLNKAIIAGPKVEDRSNMIAAVKQVTGCDIYDPFWRGAALLGELRCGGGDVPK